jgi:prolyl-tRNA synthetase
VEADSGAMGGSQSHEFMVESNAGEDFVAVCDEAKYYANLEKATSVPKPPAVPDPEGDLEPEKFHTPGKKTIAEISEFTGLPATSQIKSLVMMADNKPVLALVRGDHTMHETKFSSAVGGANEIRPAHPEEIRDLFGGTSAGSLGPIGVTNMRVIADKALEGRKNMICGANIDDYHLKNVTPGEDFKAEYFDLRQVEEGDTYEGHPIRVVKTVEIGHIFKLGYKYSKSMNLTVLDQNGKEVTPIMGSYGIGVERILTCAIELFNDKDGMSLPAAIAPFEVVVTPANFVDPAQHETAVALYEEAKKAGFDALLDDRDERPGVKFKDADLIGIPVRITIGKKLAQGVVEVVNRRTRETVDVPVAQAIETARAILRP